MKVTRNTFDDYGRLLDSRTRLNDGPEAVMHYAYDERALLSDAVVGDKVLHDTYRYDVAGRLTAQDNGLFRMALHREKPLLPASRPTYAGQVSECVWQHKNFPGTEQTYAYYYDPWGQFRTAFHYQGTRRTDRFTENGIAYDLSGNITSLTRTNDNQPKNILTYRYSGNKLLSVSDKDVLVKRFAYDRNGNVSQESQKGWNYHYNSLNLTERVTDKRLNTLAAYRYLSDGTKIGVKDAAGNGYEYLGSLIYRRTPNGLEIESSDFAGGRILKTSAKYDLRYFVRDYLGSVRAIVDGKGQRLEAIDYMPYGSRWKDPMRLVTDNRFLFNGKEWQPTGDLDVLDYGARHYDPELGRWFNPDPAMQFLNPYTFCGNDPVNLVDLNGCEATTGGFTLTDQGEIGAFLDYLRDNGILMDIDPLMNFLSEQHTILRSNGSGGGGTALNVLLPTMYVDRFGPEHLRKLQRMHEDLMRRLDHLTTMTNPIVQGIHDAQGKFMRTTIDLAGYTLQMMGEGLQYGSIALAASGLGAEAGAVVYGVSKVFNWSGTAIRGSLDMYDGNYQEASLSLGSFLLFDRFSKLGKVAKLAEREQYIWNSILFPFNDTLNNMVE